MVWAGVRKSFGRVEALRGVGLEVPSGDLVSLLGPSGCGKTTLLRVIAGFERPDEGTVSVAGRAVVGRDLHVPPERRRVAIVPQEQALFPHMTVAENVGYGVRRGPGRRARVEAVLSLAGIADLSSRMPHQLSGGQQQRVALARALAPEPSVVLLDEPFASLDAALRQALRAEVGEILRASGATALLVTHDQDEGLSMADTVVVMRDGRVVQSGPPDEVYRRPADVWVAGFVGRANILEGQVVGPGRVRSAAGDLDCSHTPSSGAVRVVIRPEQVTLCRAAAGATVEHRQYFGHDTLVRVALADGTRMLARTRSDELIAEGDRVSVSCEGEVICFPSPATPRSSTD